VIYCARTRSRTWDWAGDGAGAQETLDLFKATLVCGALAFLVYSFPVVGQVVLIGLLSLVWLSYAHKTLKALVRR
jgi:hypothetical protein